MFEVKALPFEMVNDSSGSSHNNIHACFQQTKLLGHGLPAIYWGDVKFFVPFYGIEFFRNLDCKFSCWSQDYCLNAS
ncbi:hypothetical protein SDC9_82569 [bioreactor metagenome]|uniref:Uncharacterized protein n=1 Tax=bioreactor metagenome TaxID=1076179 RepID=A0A644Z4Y1_9ZZZZ